MLLDLVQRLGIPRRAKWMLFYTFCLTAPLLLSWASTPDSLFFRFIVAPFLILRIERIRANSIGRYVAIALLVPLLFACFLEIGIAFLVIQVCSAALDARAREWQQGIYRIGAAAAGLVLAAALFPSHSLAAILAFGRGGNAVPVVPSLYTLIFIAAFLYLATKVPVRAQLSGNDRTFFLLFIYSAVLLPLAMSGGYGHIYQEMPIFLVFLAKLLADGKPLKMMLAAAILLVVLRTFAVYPFSAERRAYLRHFVPIAVDDLLHRTSPETPGSKDQTLSAAVPPLGQFDPAYSRLLDGVPAVKVPFHLDELSASEYEYLARTTRFDFGYFTDTWDVFTRSQIERKMQDLVAHPAEPVVVERYRFGALPCPSNPKTGHLFPRCEELSYFGQFLEQHYKVVRSANNLLLLEPR